MIQEKIKLLAKKYAPEYIEIRHHLHAHPELSYREFETSKFIQEKLTGLGIPYDVKAATGVIGLILSVVYLASIRPRVKAVMP